ncbi:MAG: hypothetical protein E6R03_14865 [Hyphomicrobiaceae bacterium]|nr:MAG: hypothetical protein E6R03_14865 [Hyphomicrobiaceae bacterium]
MTVPEPGAALAWSVWILSAIPTACGPLELRPAEFYLLTPDEYEWIRRGWLWRERRAEEMRATWVSHLVNGMGRTKNPVRPERLLGRMIGPKYDEELDDADRRRTAGTRGGGDRRR